jgi:hypothetical protein
LEEKQHDKISMTYDCCVSNGEHRWDVAWAFPGGRDASIANEKIGHSEEKSRLVMESSAAWPVSLAAVRLLEAWPDHTIGITHERSAVFDIFVDVR